MESERAKMNESKRWQGRIIDGLAAFLGVLLVLAAVIGLPTLIVVSTQPLTSGYVTYRSADPAHHELVCTEDTGRVCLSYRDEIIPAAYTLDISSCTPQTVHAGGFGAAFCKYNTLNVSASQYAKTRLGSYYDGGE